MSDSTAAAPAIAPSVEKKTAGSETRLGRRVRSKIVLDIAGTLNGAKAIFVFGFQNLPVGDIESLRRNLSAVSADVTMVKNSLGKRALNGSGFTSLESFLQGTSGLTVTAADPVAVSKVLVNFAKGHEGFKLRGAIVEGQPLPVDAIKALAALPAREVLLSKMLGAMQSPVIGFVGALSSIVGKVVYIIEAIRKSKEEK
ncbi:MAG: 50S ribosomal protein L10 [Candidatus Omnitrophica bacterium]|nr:50S ribosomal protein L10 [Candidatus Omnitrophota bacterium]